MEPLSDDFQPYGETLPTGEPSTPQADTPSVLPLLAPELLYVCISAKGDIQSSNAEWHRVFGDGDLWACLQPEDRRFAEEYITEAAAGSLVSNQLFLVDTPLREHPSPVLLHFIPIRLPDLTAGRYPVMITGEMLQEPTSWAQHQTKRRRMEMVGQMAMGIAHDFNNLLTSIIGHIELMKTQVVDCPETAEHLQAMEGAAVDGAALVRKIQRYIRHEKRERFEPINLHVVIKEVSALTRPYWYNEPRRQGIEIRLVTEIEDVQPIRGSEAEIREVLVNLILNAVQAMPDGGTLTLRVFGDEHAIYAEVEDTGVGMPDSVRDRIFEPMFSTKGEAGTGMGLTVSYGIIEEHEGIMQVRTQVGKGTCFSLRFPPLRRMGPVSTQTVTEPSAVSNTELRLRILLVDDEPMVRSVAAQLLRLRGFTVDEASSAQEALRISASQPFDLVLTDLGMPEMSGSELARQLKKKKPFLPIILVTGHTDAEDQSEHVDAVVRKPFKADQLVDSIRKVMAEPDA